MTIPTSQEIKRAYLDYFIERRHTEVPSAPLAPRDDPTLLFNSAGMVQFKPYWAGTEPVPFAPPRATSLQKCFRLSDLENVGRTPRHHTFFEMLGNFSFGDYFKEEAIRWAWELSTEVLGMDAGRIHAAVYLDDDEAHRLWSGMIGLPGERVVRLGAEDNFWGPAGKTGACGPSSELYWDYGAEYGCGKPTCGPGCECDRFVEYWNLVFPQFYKNDDGEFEPLKNRGIDTGLGTERLTAILQGVDNNYETDLFIPIIEAAAALVGHDPRDPEHRHRLWAVADHARALTVALAEGIFPSNTGRGYVLRRLLRRAGRLGFEMGLKEPFVHRLVEPVNRVLADSYPELETRAAHTAAALEREERRFLDTLSDGLEVFERVIADLDGRVIPGEEAFKLYDTFGFPVDLTAVMAEERGLSVDVAGFEEALERARERSRASASFYSSGDAPRIEGLFSEFVGYDTLKLEARVSALFDAGQAAVDALSADEEGSVVLDVTPFYAEGGGQIGDGGRLEAPGTVFRVTDTQSAGAAVLHLGRVELGSLRVGDEVTARVDEARRHRTAAHHSATHLLHWALRRVLGEGATQAGSFVGPDRLRFDINHHRGLSDAETAEVVHLVNERVVENAPVRWEVVPLEEAKRRGATALFGEKYGDEVRLIAAGDYSLELCGGTHVAATGEIGSCLLVGDSALAAGVRRLEAVCGLAAVEYVEERERKIDEAARLLKVPPTELATRIEALLEERKRAEKRIGELEQRLASGAGGRDLAAETEEINGRKVLLTELAGVGAKALRGAVDKLKAELGSAVILLATIDGSKVALACGLTEDLVAEGLNAGKLVKAAAQAVGGGGGGRPDFAQAGGSRPDALPEAFAAVRDLLTEAP